MAPSGVVAGLHDLGLLLAVLRGEVGGGPTVQRLVEELPARPRDVLWGTIHPANAPSLRNALSVGRVQVGGYVWVAPAGWPGMPASAIG